MLDYNIYWLCGLVGRVFTNGPGDLGSIPGRVIPKTFKMVLDTSLLNSQQYKGKLSRVKWSNPGKEVAPSPTPRCSSYLGSPYSRSICSIFPICMESNALEKSTSNRVA